MSALAPAIATLLLLVRFLPPALAFHFHAPAHKVVIGTRSTAKIMSLHDAPSSTADSNADSNANANLNLIDTDRLLSSLIHAASLGSSTISSLSDVARSGNIVYKEANDARSALTVADTSAQRVIVSSILGKYPSLNLVGEEDESVEVDKEYERELRDDLLANYEWTTSSGGAVGEAPPTELDMSELVVYVDPLDGTREFVEGRLDNVQTLIGVCRNGVPIMGAVGLPFPTNKINNATEVVFGLVGRGIGKVCTERGASSENDIVPCPLPEMKQYNDGDAIHISSGDSSSVRPAVDLAEKIFASKGGVQRQMVGATGNKLLRVACGDTTLSLLHDKTSLWDTAAPTAILASLGGKVTDYYGDPLVYNPEGEIGNKMGVVASAAGAGARHDEITGALRDGNMANFS